jgi:hypothetical protein
MSRAPFTADERERRFVQYAVTLNKGQLAEMKLRRLNRIANFRKQLMELINEMIETRAEDLAASMLMEHAPERPEPLKQEWKVIEGRLPLPERKRRMPKWVREERIAVEPGGRRASR